MLLPFTGNPLDRRSEMRPDAAWVAEQRRAARILPLWQLQVLVTGSPVLHAAWLDPAMADELAGAAATSVFLGLDGDTPLFAIDLSAAENAPEALQQLGEFRDLRAAAPFLRTKDLAILAQAKALLDWHQRHGFSARCGAATVIAEAGNRRDCPRCEAQHFPRTDPAVIMLVTHGEACLLARNVKWADNFYSTLAGFVEPGECLEEAVRREVQEEVGLTADAVRYFASQPWPFPAALMIGCYAEVDGKALKLDPGEIADAKWFSKADALDLINGETDGFRGPMKAAIAYHLINEWATG